MLKKVFLFLTGLLMYFNVNAQEPGFSEVGSAQMEQYVELLNSIEGYVFVSKNERRDIVLPLARTEEVMEGVSGGELKAMNWTSYNPDIAQIDNNGVITGNSYGETIVQASDGNDIHNFIVFVCPVVTVVSPEGIVYKYHKTYNQKMKIYLSRSENFAINCVLKDGVDITDKIVNGYYESEEPVTQDFTLHISEETGDHNEVMGNSGIRILVRGSDVTFQTNRDLSNKIVYVFTQSKERILYDSPLPSNNTIRFLSQNHGVFYITIEDIDEEFKIAIE